MKKLSVEFAFEENISLRISYEEYITWLAKTKLLGLAISISSKKRYLCTRPQKFILTKEITFLISITLSVIFDESFAVIVLGKTSLFKLFYVLLPSFLCNGKTIQVIHLLCINVKKVDTTTQ